MVSRQREAHSAPAAADVEHAHSWLDPQFLGNMGLLLFLRDFKRVVRRAEIGARILPVRIQE